MINNVDGGPHLCNRRVPLSATSRPAGEINDYAQKNWAGLVGDYYMARWSLHGEYLTSSVIAGQPIDWNAYTTDLFNLEW